MIKQVSSSIFCASVFFSAVSSSCFSDANGTLPWEVATSDLFIAGTSLVDGQLQKYISDLCGDNGGNIVAFSYSSAGATTESYNAYFCDVQISATVNSGSLAASRYLLLHKRSEGGSVYGARPVAASQSISRLDVSSGACTEFTVGNPDGDSSLTTTDSTPSPKLYGVDRQFNCDGALVNDVPEGGVSLVEPYLFRSSNIIDPNIPENGGPSGGILAGDPGTTSISASEASSLTVVQLLANTYGIQVSLGLRNALQAAEFGVSSSCVGSDEITCMPSLRRSVVASMFVDSVVNIKSWNDLLVDDGGIIRGLADFASLHGLVNPIDDLTFDLSEFSGSGTAPLSSDLRVHVCRSSPGSGLQAQFDANFSNTPCSVAANISRRDNDSSTSRVDELYRDNDLVLSQGAVNSQVIVHENQTAIDLRECVDDLNVRGAWAIGMNFISRGSSGTRFIAIDGVAPTLENVSKGAYKDWAGATIQFKTSTSSDDALIMQDFAVSAFSPAEIALANSAQDDAYIYEDSSGTVRSKYGSLAFPPGNTFVPPFDASQPTTAFIRRSSGSGVPSTCVSQTTKGGILIN